MNTIYDNEATRYQANEEDNTQYQSFDNEEYGLNEESTEFNEEAIDEAANAPADETAKPKKGIWQKAAIGGAAALVVGAVATVSVKAFGKENPTEDSGKTEDGEVNPEDIVADHPAWTDGNIQVATAVTDGMTFNEAFAAARAEVGPGGCFEWHGNIYGTYTAQEWNSMSAAEQAEWNGHFDWNHLDTPTSDVAHHTTTSHHHTDPAHADDDIDVVSVTHTDGNHESYEPAVSNNELVDNSHPGYHDVAVEQADPDVEILGVVHDDASGMNLGGVSVDGQEVIFIDVDDNLVFDYMASDVNNNGQFEDSEIVDIQDQGLTVADLGGFTEDPTGDMYASNDSVDISDDITYEG